MGHGGLGIRSAVHLAPSAFLASADAASSIVIQLLPITIDSSVYPERDVALSTWKESVTPNTEPQVPPSSHHQKSWIWPCIVTRWDSPYSNADTPQTAARLLAASSKESGAWLNALPCSALGLRMSNDTVRIATGLRLGTPLCQPHICVQCNREVSSLGLHGLSCLKSQGRHSRHFDLNRIIHLSLHSAKIPSKLEPSGLSTSTRSRPDGLSLTPWSRGKFLVWDATCTDTFCASNIALTSSEPGRTAAHAESEKLKTYSYLCRAYCFVPVGVETTGVFGPQAHAFLKELGRRLRNVSGDQLSYT